MKSRVVGKLPLSGREMTKKAVRVAAVGVVPVAWRKILERKKTLVGWPEWPTATPLPTGKRIRSRRDDVRTASAEETEVLLQFVDEHGIGIEGVRLRLKAWAFHRNRDVTATLEVAVGKSFVTIGRVDGWPSSPHMNVRAVLKTHGLKKLPQVLDGCHVHRFADNSKIGLQAFGKGPEGNLPAAVKIPNGLGSFRQFLRMVETEFSIEGLSEFPAPPGWQGML
jgi:hypothetical protein